MKRTVIKDSIVHRAAQGSATIRLCHGGYSVRWRQVNWRDSPVVSMIFASAEESQALLDALQAAHKAAFGETK